MNNKQIYILYIILALLIITLITFCINVNTIENLEKELLIEKYEKEQCEIKIERLCDTYLSNNKSIGILCGANNR